jgi:glycosyltransferase involved in cell wall biosynthesis
VSDRFELTGWVSDERLDDLYGQCVATVSPSTYEGYGLPVAESLVRGLPTIASDIPPHREIAGHAALYFAPGDSAALAELLTKVATSPTLRAEMAQKAAERYEQLTKSGLTWAQAILGMLSPTGGKPPARTTQVAA